MQELQNKYTQNMLIPTLATTLCFFLFGFTTYFPLPFTHADSDDITKDVNVARFLDKWWRIDAW